MKFIMITDLTLKRVNYKDDMLELRTNRRCLVKPYISKFCQNIIMLVKMKILFEK
jgi:DNA recombination-dependent growth factor C